MATSVRNTMKSTVTGWISIFTDGNRQFISGLNVQAGGFSWMMDQLGDDELGDGDMSNSTGLYIREAHAE